MPLTKPERVVQAELQRREAQRPLERQLERRAAAVQWDRRATIAAAVLGVLGLVALALSGPADRRPPRG